MPLPNFKNYCEATCRATGEPCKNPAAYQCRTCRMHGAKPTEAVKRGAEHGRYKTGQYTQATKAAYKAASAKLMDLETIGFNIGILTGSRTPGRKPG